MIFVSEHAAEQGTIRCGLSPTTIIEKLEESLEAGTYYEHTQEERWVALEGPKGLGTAIIKRDFGVWEVITVRDSSVFTQAERAREKLTAKMKEFARRPAGVSFKRTPGILVRIEGDKVINLDGRDAQGPLPTVHYDGGLIKRLLDWCWTEGIRPMFGSPGINGGGIYCHVHTPEDAEKIAAWLRSQGAKER
jgi:hypothetical protein